LAGHDHALGLGDHLTPAESVLQPGCGLFGGDVDPCAGNDA